MSEIKSMALDRLLMSSEDQLEDWFAHGAIAVGNKWRPAKEGEEPDKPLGQLVQERYERRERLRLMPKDSTKPPITSLGGPILGAMTADVETTLGEPQEPEPEMVDKDTLERFAESADNNHSVIHAEDERRAEMRSYLARLRQLGIEQIKAGRDPAPVFRSALEQMEERRKAA